MAEAKYCPNCGARANRGDNYCSSCGRDLRQQQSEAGASQEATSSGATSSTGALERRPASRAGAQREEQMWATVTHLAGFLGFFFPLVGNILGPFLVWVLKKDDLSLVDRHGKEAINFQISVSIYAVICIVLAFVLIGIFLGFALSVFWVVMVVVAAVRASEGRDPGYALAMRFLR